MILEEFDMEKKAVLNPSDIIDKVEGMPKVAVACYSKLTFDRMLEKLKAECIAKTGSANGEEFIYKATYQGVEVALFMIGVGAPMSIGILEEVFEMGVEKVVVFGTCGVLDSSIEDCSIIIPNSAMRDEGTSYHYAPSSDEIAVNEKYLGTFTSLLNELKIHYTVGKAWTTDAIYRETPKKVQKRKEQGCICVDMECSANAAVAAFRGKDLVQFFYAADNLDSEEWDKRSLANEARLDEKDKVALIALELATRL